jgi:hypothetical protein
MLGTGTTMQPIVASLRIFGQRPGEERFEINVEIRQPYLVDAKESEWACPVAVRPLHKVLRDAHAGDSFQALCMASYLALNLLHAFTEDGGLLTLEGGDAFPIDAYSFGIAVKKASS